MKYAISLFALFALALPAQEPRQKQQQGPTDIVLPSGKTWKEELIAHSHEENVRDARKLADLTAQIAGELEGGDKYVFSLKTMKKVEEAEKLARGIRERMRQR